jgi:transposase-like protein
MSSKISKHWLEAGIILAKDASAKVTCPQCGAADLVVLDAYAGTTLERWMQCPVCHAKNTLLMRRSLH